MLRIHTCYYAGRRRRRRWRGYTVRKAWPTGSRRQARIRKYGERIVLRGAREVGRIRCASNPVPR